MTALRVAAIVFAIWLILGGSVAVIASLSDPVPELGPIAGLMGVVLGILVLLGLWAFPRSSRRGRAYGDDD